MKLECCVTFFTPIGLDSKVELLYRSTFGGTVR
jgi:hypothetical protein